MSDSEFVILACEVPEDDRPPIDDVPEAYRVAVPDYHVPGDCIIYGRYHGKWHANVPARWLVRHLIEEGNKLRKEVKAVANDLDFSPCLRDRLREALEE